MNTITTDRTEARERDRKLCQAIGEALWAAATSENYDFAWSRSQVYRNLERAFIASVRAAYGLSEMKAGRVRSLLAEYGPHDSLQGTSGYGVASYVEFANSNSARDYAYV